MSDRLSQIVTLLNERGFLSISETAEFFQVTTMTVRRDLKKLEDSGYIYQVKNGAIPRPRLAIGQYNSEQPTVKHLLARELIKILSPRDVILLSAGSTALACAQVLAAVNAELTVLTYSLPIASALFQSRCHVILLGGELRNNSQDILGPLTEENLKNYHVNYLITGCDGADSETGFFTTDLNLANLEKISVGIADQVVVVTESKKFKQKSLVRFLALDDTDILITDKRLNTVDQQQLLRHQSLRTVLI